MGNLRDDVLNSKAVREATVQYRLAKSHCDRAAENYKREKNNKKAARESQKLEQIKAEKAYDEAVREALEKAKEYYGDKKFTAQNLYRFTDGDIGRQEFASWVWHKVKNEESPQSFSSTLAIVDNYHLPSGVKTTHPRKIVKKFAELDDNGQPIPGTEFIKEHTECALYWFED